MVCKNLKWIKYSREKNQADEFFKLICGLLSYNGKKSEGQSKHGVASSWWAEGNKYWKLTDTK